MQLVGLKTAEPSPDFHHGLLELAPADGLIGIVQRLLTCAEIFVED